MLGLGIWIYKLLVYFFIFAFDDILFVNDHKKYAKRVATAWSIEWASVFLQAQTTLTSPRSSHILPRVPRAHPPTHQPYTNCTTAHTTGEMYSSFRVKYFIPCSSSSCFFRAPLWSTTAYTTRGSTPIWRSLFLLYLNAYNFGRNAISNVLTLEIAINKFIRSRDHDFPHFSVQLFIFSYRLRL